MPLVSGSSPEAFRQNVSTLMGEIGKSPHVQSREQALAIAYAKQRRGRAEGGDVGGSTLVDHDNDPDLPRRQDPAQLIDMMPLPRGYEDPAYIQTIRRLLLQQHYLNSLHPVEREMLRRYWLGGYLGGRR
jgi:hypothetical protein